MRRIFIMIAIWTCSIAFVPAFVSFPVSVTTRTLVISVAHKKGAGSTRNGRDSNSQRRGVKMFGSQKAIAGNILIRQLGAKVKPGLNVGMGKDYTLYATTAGRVKFAKNKKSISIVSEEAFLAAYM